MADETASTSGAAGSAAAVGAAAGSTGPAPGSSASPPAGPEVDPFAERPELFVGGAFVGGLALAFVMRRLGRE